MAAARDEVTTPIRRTVCSICGAPRTRLIADDGVPVSDLRLCPNCDVGLGVLLPLDPPRAA